MYNIERRFKYYFLLLTLLIVSVNARGVIKTPLYTVIDTCIYNSSKEQTFENKVMEKAIRAGDALVGKRYRSRVKGFNRSLDCSGFMMYIYNSVGIKIPQSSGSIARVVQDVYKDSIRRGDLLFFKGRNSRSSRVGHVGIVTSIDSSKIIMMHSHRSGIMYTESTKSAYYRRRFIKAGRIQFVNDDTPLLSSDRSKLNIKYIELLNSSNTVWADIVIPTPIQFSPQEIEKSREIKESKKRFNILSIFQS